MTDSAKTSALPSVKDAIAAESSGAPAHQAARLSPPQPEAAAAAVPDSSSGERTAAQRMRGGGRHQPQSPASSPAPAPAAAASGDAASADILADAVRRADAYGADARARADAEAERIISEATGYAHQLIAERIQRISLLSDLLVERASALVEHADEPLRTRHTLNQLQRELSAASAALQEPSA